MDKVSKDLINAISESGKTKTQAYDTSATVTRIDGGTAWVHIPGGVNETPVKMTISASVGDTVQVRVSGGGAWLVGNATTPPTGDAKAIEAAVQAGIARIRAESAQKVAEVAQELATNAKDTADSVDEKATSALSNSTSAIHVANAAEEVAGLALNDLVVIYYASNSSSAPSAPSSEVSTDTSVYNQWTKIIPSYNSTYPYLYRCSEMFTESTGFVGCTLVEKLNYTEIIASISSTANSSISGISTLYYASSSTTAPAKPTAHVSTGTTTTYGAWSIVLPTLNTNYPYLYICKESVTNSGTYAWTNVEPTTYQQVINTLSSSVNDSIASITTLYYASNSTTVPSKPTAHVGTGSARTYGAWSTILPTSSDTYPYLYTCQETATNSGTYAWTNAEPTTYASVLLGISNTASSAYNTATAANNTATAASNTASSAYNAATAANNSATAAYNTATAASNTASSAYNTATAAQYDIDNLEVGGRNLVWDTAWNDISNRWSNWGSPTTREIVTVNGIRYLHVVTTATAFQGYNQSMYRRNGLGEITAGDQIMISFRAYGAQAGNTACIGIHFLNSSGAIVSQYWCNPTLTTSSAVYSSGPCTVPTNAVGFNVMVGRMTANVQEIWIGEVKLERGNKATDWTPAPEDIEVKTANYFFHDTDGAHVVQTANNASTGYNTLVTGTGFSIRSGTTTLSSWSSSALQFYKPNTTEIIASFGKDTSGNALTVLGSTASRNVVVDSGGLTIRNGVAPIGTLDAGDIRYYDGNGTSAENVVASFGLSGASLKHDGNSLLQANSDAFQLGVDKSIFLQCTPPISGATYTTFWSSTSIRVGTYSTGVTPSTSKNLVVQYHTYVEPSGNFSYNSATMLFTAGQSTEIPETIISEPGIDDYIDTAVKLTVNSSGQIVITSVDGGTGKYLSKAYIYGPTTETKLPNLTLNANVAEGVSTTASGDASHAEGHYTTALGNYSHAEGYANIASGNYSHAGGYYTIAGSDYQTAIGKFNSNSSGNLFEIGNGSATTARSNALAVSSTGNVTAAGALIPKALKVSYGYNSSTIGSYFTVTSANATLSAFQLTVNSGVCTVRIVWTNKSAISVPANGNITNITIGTLAAAYRPGTSFVAGHSHGDNSGAAWYSINRDGTVALGACEGTGTARTIAAGSTFLCLATYVLGVTSLNS